MIIVFCLRYKLNSLYHLNGLLSVKCRIWNHIRESFASKQTRQLYVALDTSWAQFPSAGNPDTSETVPGDLGAARLVDKDGKGATLPTAVQ
jgi:hypothetical protein